MLHDLTLRSLPDAVRARLVDVDLREAGIVVAQRGNLLEARRQPLELRAAEDGSVALAGYAAAWGVAYDVYGGPERGGWTETVAKGAVTKSLAERDDVRFLINHDGLPLARTKSGTLRLASDDLGLYVDVPALDMANPRAIELVSVLRRGDGDQMSWAFMVVRQEWNNDYTERLILEAKMYDVSAVTYPANPATIIGVRSDATEVEPRGTSLRLALAQAEALGL